MEQGKKTVHTWHITKASGGEKRKHSLAEL